MIQPPSNHTQVCVCIIEYFALEKNPENAQILRHHEAKKKMSETNHFIN